ncbi:anti-sigma factor [Desertivirga brevis]|uniref:anti-sigma factor n=1 Tax=Desertivirga brevis TaxID=2810310 RepID=UPI001A95B642|nr:anti-sigma factor [Pedobacter sp. SYSU D00873]
MEDLKAYIESGVLELYALGDLSPGERQEVELMLQKHPELRYELNEIEKALEKYAEKHALEPEESVRERVIGTLDFKEGAESDLKEEATVKAFPAASNNSAKNSNFYKYAFAASVALLLLSTVVIINLRSQLSESNERVALLESSNQKFSSRANYIEKELTDVKHTLDVYQNPKEFKMVELKGLPKAPEAKMMVAFSPKKEMVMIDLASLKMPKTDEKHQYQLWALVDGKPVDLGVFDMKPDSTGMIKMKPLKNAQAFAVTLEPKGGSVNPTMDEMIVMGSI